MLYTWISQYTVFRTARYLEHFSFHHTVSINGSRLYLIDATLYNRRGNKILWNDQISGVHRIFSFTKRSQTAPDSNPDENEILSLHSFAGELVWIEWAVLLQALYFRSYLQLQLLHLKVQPVIDANRISRTTLIKAILIDTYTFQSEKFKVQTISDAEYDILKHNLYGDLDSHPGHTLRVNPIPIMW